ncbi:NYN domain-containing protein [Candidatus Woesearchaeota archaeon]|nr:MAG: NYN domain-containing protein [Candidatus Woesearchaeota archaeon]
MDKYKNQRIAVLVDVQNMYYSAKNIHKRKVNFGSVLKKAVGERQLIRAIAYVIKADIKEEINFFEALQSFGYEVKAKDLQVFLGGAKKGDWDIGIAMDALKLSQKVDVLVLVSGDGDFIPLVKYLQEAMGVRVELMAFKETTSNKLIDEVDDYFPLDRKFLI